MRRGDEDDDEGVSSCEIECGSQDREASSASDAGEGSIELADPPADLPEGPVRVIVLIVNGPKPPLRMINFGMYPGDTSTLDDFEDGRWEKEWDNGHGQ